MIIKTQPQTIFLLIGPSNCGKSYFSKHVLIPQLKEQLKKEDSNIQYLSSDNIRRELLGDKLLKKTHYKMMPASEQAFSLLFQKLKSVTSYPVNADFIIIDTTGLSESFRKDVQKIARDQNYHIDAIVFAYDNREDYTKYFDEEESIPKKDINNHLRRLNQEVMRTLGKKDYNNIHKIRSIDFINESVCNVQIEVKDIDVYNSCFLDPMEYTVIGDIHGCFEEFIESIILHGGVIVNDCNQDIPSLTLENNKKFILIGDYIDKGPDSRRVVDFIYNNIDCFILVVGNHENFVYKHLNGKLKDINITPEALSYFDGINFEPEYVEKLNFLFSKSRPFAAGNNFIVTHAPVENKYLGKWTSTAQKAQRYFRYLKRHEFATEEEWLMESWKRLGFLLEEAQYNLPLHIFGHVVFKQIFKHKNKVGLDTGCVHGGKLSTITPNKNNKPFIQNIQAKKVYSEGFFIEYKYEDHVPEIDMSELSYEDRRRIHFSALKKVNFVAGTMSPPAATETELETLRSAFDYYKSKGITEVVLQPKYMGSNCTIYLFKEVEKCYATSRNGFIIKQVDLTPLYLKLQEDFVLDSNTEMIMLYGELMPWHALGKGLIEREFQVVNKGLESELSTIKEKGFEEMLYKAFENPEIPKFKFESVKTSKVDMVEKYGPNNYELYKILMNYKHTPIEIDQDYHAVYAKQMELYGAPGDLDFKPFALLKTVKTDGTETTYQDMKTSENFNMVSDDTMIIVDLNDELSIAIGEAFYAGLTVDGLEGVVVKPEIINPKVAPYLKVRNMDYLSLIYGYDYIKPHKYKKMVERKRVDKKTRVSIQEYNIGQKLLSIPYNAISIDNVEYKKVLLAMLFEEKKESTIDPRL